MVIIVLWLVLGVCLLVGMVSILAGGLLLMAYKL